MRHIADDCTDRMFALVAEVYRDAIKQARRGNEKAIEWLDVTMPDWREVGSRYNRLAQGGDKKAIYAAKAQAKRDRKAMEVS
jgi:hypothetical protein